MGNSEGAGPERVAALVSPIRRLLLQNLKTADSASGLARKLGISRQKLNYHLRELERAGFVELAEERQRRGCVERRVRVTSRAFVVSPEFLEGLAADPREIQDCFSSAYLVAASARLVRDVATLRERAAGVDQRLATVTIEAETSFASPSDFKAFSEELASEVTRLAAKYNTGDPKCGRRFRILAGVYPVLTKTEDEARREIANHTAGKERKRYDPGKAEDSKSSSSDRD